MYDVIIIGAEQAVRQSQGNCPGIRENFVCWKKKQMFAAGRPKRTVGSLMQDLM